MSTKNSIQTLTVQTPKAVALQPTEPIQTRLKPERVQETLAGAPAWQLLGGTAVLHREKKFPDAVAALLYSSYVSSLASSLKVNANVRLRGLRVLVTLGSRRKDRSPLTEPQLGFAVMIS
ncbi:MAG: hypothetical protein JF614_19810 [Acidobacteria bacterium]|jgi:pterin-4a-carbinolamine dehydratase|nr:hypothetical protein [Acidobacteriota bacterium]